MALDPLLGCYNDDIADYLTLIRTDNEDQDNRDKKLRTTVPQWRTVFVIVVFSVAVVTILSLPRKSLEARAGVVIATTALFWVTESMPLMISALVPAILFPFGGVMTAKAVAAKYFNDISMLMLGTFLMAESIESCGLHRRIALKILSLLGRGEALLILGAMLTTWKLSMFMSNTATCAMMLPIIAAIIESLRSIQREGEKSGALKMVTLLENKSAAAKVEEEEEEEEDEEEDSCTTTKYDSPQFKWFCKGLILSIPYGASIGGIATLTGTPPNFVFKGYYDGRYPKGPSVDYAKWMAFAYPMSFLIVIVGWHVMVLVYARSSYFSIFRGIYEYIVKGIARVKGKRQRFNSEISETDNNAPYQSEEQRKWKYINQSIREKYRQLGPLRFPEIVLFFMVILLVLLWLLRDPTGITGWSRLHYNLTYFEKPDGSGKDKVFLTDSWVVILIGLCLFNIPTENPFTGDFLFRAPPGRRIRRSTKLLTLDTVMKKTPWDVLILLGGGYAIAAGCEQSGLSKWLGESFKFLEGQNHIVIGLVISVLVASLTEVASNTASTTLFMPILGSVSETLKMNPLFLLITGTVSASLAFCLPSATGPNALVFSFKEIRVVDMLRTGVIMNILSVLIVVLGVSTWTSSIMDITHDFPDWASGGG